MTPGPDADRRVSRLVVAAGGAGFVASLAVIAEVGHLGRDGLLAPIALAVLFSLPLALRIGVHRLPGGPAGNPGGAGQGAGAGRRAGGPPRPCGPSAAAASLGDSFRFDSAGSRDIRPAWTRPASTGVSGRTSWRRMPRVSSAVLFAFAHQIPLALLARHGGPVQFLAPLALLGLYAVALRRHDLAAAAAVALALLQGFVAIALSPGPVTLLLLPVVATAAFSAAVAVHGRAACRGGGDRIVTDEVQLVQRRSGSWRIGTMLSSAVLLLALVLQVGAGLTAEAFKPSADRSETARSPRRGAGRGLGSRGGAAAPADRAPPGGDDTARSFFADLGSEQSRGPESYEAVMQVRPRRGAVPTGDMGVFHLRGVVYDHFDERGVRLSDRSPLPLVADGDDGALDGWINWPEVDVAEPPLVLEIDQLPAPLHPLRWSLLFLPQQAAALRMPVAGHDPDRATADVAIRDDWFTYSVVVGRPRAWMRAAARHPDSRYTAVPAGAAMERIARAAEDIAGDRETSFAKVVAVMDHFDAGFAYTLDTAADLRPEGIEEFLERRSGHCTHYASASVLLLRSLGVPSRLVGGYLVSRFNPAVDGYDVLGVDGHAWVEVHFEGAGWIAFDPTPAVERERRLASELEEIRRREEEETARRTGLAGVMRSWLAGRADPQALRDALSAVAAFVRRRLPLVLIALGVFLIARSVRGHLRARSPEGRRDRALAEAEDATARILRALSRHGLRRAPAETLREIALRAAGALGRSVADLPALVECLYAVRFGGASLGTEDERRIDAFVARLEGRSPNLWYPEAARGDSPDGGRR